MIWRQKADVPLDLSPSDSSGPNPCVATLKTGRRRLTSIAHDRDSVPTVHRPEKEAPCKKRAACFRRREWPTILCTYHLERRANTTRHDAPRSDKPTLRNIDQAKGNIMKRLLAIVALTSCLQGLVAAQSAPTTPTNFDPASFGNSMIFLGRSGTATVHFDRSCADPSLTTPPDQCVIVPSADSGGPTSFSFPDLGSITIPAESTKTILWPVFILNARYKLNNTNGGPLPGVFTTFIDFTIESDVLKDPSLIDPNSGLPYNGRLTTGFGNIYGENRLLAPGEFDIKHLRAASTGIDAFSTSFLEDPGGQNLPANVVKKLFASPMTIRVGLEGNVRLVDPDFGSYAFVGLRLIGDKDDK